MIILYSHYVKETPLFIREIPDYEKKIELVRDAKNKLSEKSIKAFFNDYIRTLSFLCIHWIGAP